MTRGAELLRLHRRARGLTQAGLGRLIGDRPWRNAQVCAWETGRVKPRGQNRRRMERLSGGLIQVDAWDAPAEAIPAAAQTSLLDMIPVASEARP